MITIHSDQRVTMSSNKASGRESIVLQLPQILDARVAHGIVDAVVGAYRATGHLVVDSRWILAFQTDAEYRHHCKSCGFEVQL